LNIETNLFLRTLENKMEERAGTGIVLIFPEGIYYTFEKTGVSTEARGKPEKPLAEAILGRRGSG